MGRGRHIRNICGNRQWCLRFRAENPVPLSQLPGAEAMGGLTGETKMPAITPRSAKNSEKCQMAHHDAHGFEAAAREAGRYQESMNFSFFASSTLVLAYGGSLTAGYPERIGS